MLTRRYMSSIKNLAAILSKIVSGTAPSKFTTAHLKGIGFPSSNDRAIIPLLKDLGFLSQDGVPTQRYHEYRNPASSKTVLGEALRDAYEDLFHHNANPTKNDRDAIIGTFKTVNNVSDRIAELQAMTFFALLDKADLGQPTRSKPRIPAGETQQGEKGSAGSVTPPLKSLQLRYNIEVHLPATKDVEVYNAIFKALKENLGE